MIGIDTVCADKGRQPRTDAPSIYDIVGYSCSQPEGRLVLEVAPGPVGVHRDLVAGQDNAAVVGLPPPSRRVSTDWSPHPMTGTGARKEQHLTQDGRELAAADRPSVNACLGVRGTQFPEGRDTIGGQLPLADLVHQVSCTPGRRLTVYRRVFGRTSGRWAREASPECPGATK